jgi:vacuolar protein sorting-associated protein 13A/C
MTLCEESRLPPSFRGCKSSSKDMMKMLVDKVNMNSKLILSRTITIVTVIVDHDLLELCNGIDVESPLAHIVVSNLKGQIMYFCRGGGWSY